jgi:hypothetical protein
MAHTNANVRRCSLKIDPQYTLAQVVAVADKVAEVLSGNFCFASELARLFSLELKLFDISLKADADVVGWALERTPDLGADSQRICVCVVDGGQLCR